MNVCLFKRKKALGFAYYHQMGKKCKIYMSAIDMHEIEYIKSSAWWWNVQWGKILGVSWNGDFAIEKLEPSKKGAKSMVNTWLNDEDKFTIIWRSIDNQTNSKSIGALIMEW